MTSAPEILETDEEFEERYARVLAVTTEGARWERQRRAYVMRDLALREQLIAALNRLADELRRSHP